MISIENYLKFKQEFPLSSIAAAQARDKAYSDFLEIGLPTKQDEAWKFTSIKKNIHNLYHLKTADFLLDHYQLLEIKDHLKENFINIVFVNGIVNKTLSDDYSDFIFLADIEAADFNFSDSVTELKTKNLSYSLLTDQIKINIKKNTEKNNIHILLFQNNNQSQILSTQVSIEIEENAKAQIIVSQLGSQKTKATHFLNFDATIQLNRNASLDFLNIQNQSENDTHLSRTTFIVKEGAQLKSLDLALGSKLSRHYSEVKFTENNAFAGLYGAVCISNDQHSDHYTYIHHIKGQNHSVQKHKTILMKQSNSVFRGRIRIEPNSQKAKSEQVNNNLLLSREAQAQSVPQLEIYADDVQAAHGSTTGQMNAEELFYFLSRGINSIEATQMLSYGYVVELINLFEEGLIRNEAKKAIDQKLQGMII